MVNYLICSCVLLLHCCVILILDLGHRNEDELVQTSTRGYCNPIAYSLELSTNLREVSQCPEKGPLNIVSRYEIGVLVPKDHKGWAVSLA